MPNNKDRQQITRLLMIALGAALLIWLPFEDTQMVWISLFAMLISSLIAFYAASNISPEKRQRWYFYPAIGALAGLVMTPISLLLMAFKSGLHGHGSPEFTSGQVTAVLNSWLIWVTAGTLIGFLALIWQKVR